MMTEQEMALIAIDGKLIQLESLLIRLRNIRQEYAQTGNDEVLDTDGDKWIIDLREFAK